ncbi:MAG: polysaccharide biosynthesis/export family protein [Bacteroidales bacterium]|nr:polysaccharide biosynthesis/export family protein [Bacteroidales bacterium]
MRHFIANLFTAIAIVAILSGCSSRKQVVYIQGADQVEGGIRNEHPFALTIKPDDKLSIIVNCKEPELAAPFNMQLNQKNFATTGNVTFAQSGGTPQPFWVDQAGEILYPTIGRLEVAGMTRYELREYLQDYLKSNGYIQDPIVTVEFYNARYTVIGEVLRPGQFPFNSDRVTIFDAVSSAGDLTVFGERDKVHVIRQQDGKEVVGTVDLTSPEVIKSPYYFLQQNDVVYVEPNKAKASNREMSTLYSFGISFVTLAVSIATLVVNIKRL